MPLARWWSPLTRWLLPAPGPADSATPAGRPPVLPQPAKQALPVDPEQVSSAASSSAPTEAVSGPIETPAETRSRFLGWLLACPEPIDSVAALPAAAAVERLLKRLDEVIASDTLRATLLPRAPNVVPQLMKTLRDEHYSSVDVAERISKDVVLSAEVIRSATSAFRHDGEGETDLARAVAVIGAQGLRRAIASVVLRPIFDARGDSLSARAAAQIWQDADRKAKLCAALATERKLDPFDGYLAGLLHNTGWTAALRAIDGFQDTRLGALDLAHPRVAGEMFRRRDTLFGALVQPWQLSTGINELAAELARGGLAAAQSDLGNALRLADRLAMLRALAPAGHDAATVVPEWATLSKPVQTCYAGLGRA